MDIIKLLPKNVSNQIAAGEVIQRPASAIKELLENAIDAGANNIKVHIKKGGKNVLQVIDNGCGMTSRDAKLCFKRHATSKIKVTKDLFLIKTMGFRGEAMASIAAISYIDMKTKSKDEKLGNRIIIEGGEIKSQKECVFPEGTSITIKNLFYNVPARRRFLKSDKVETYHIIEQFNRIALANPKIVMNLYIDNKEHTHLNTSNDRQRIVSIMGVNSNEKLVPLQEKTTLVELNGFIGKPEYCKRTRGNQYLFVNKRFIKNRYLNHAIKKAYEGLMPDNYFCTYFLYLGINPELIDVNIHPTKTEIKFEDEKSIYSIIRASVKYSLGKYNIAPTIDFNQEISFNIPTNKSKDYIKEPEINIDKSYNPFKQEKQKDISSWQHLLDETSTTQTEINMTWEDSASYKEFIQIGNEFIVTEGKNEMIIINQRRAHERIIFEHFKKILEKSKKHSQYLAIHNDIKLSKNDITLIKDIKPDLNTLGFHFKTSKDSILINSMPAECKEKDLKNIIEEILEQKKKGENLRLKETDLIVKILSKNMSIRKRKLELEEMKKITKDLFNCDTPTMSPNGKPIIINLSINNIRKYF